ncbi:MAG TPA: hypothetical protein VF532_09550 [Candidatus Angelobacter sp.]
MSEIANPQFTLEDNLWWTTTALLPSWKGFQSRKGAYGAQDTPAPSDGLVRIVFAPEGRRNQPLTDSEISAVNWAIEHESSISKALISSLLREYPSLQKQYGYSAKEKAELMPDVKSAEDLRALIGLSSVNVHQVQKDGIPYMGFEFGCTWDEEHGLGVLMHGTRTVRIGGADTAILLWIAEQDAQKPPRAN